MGCQDSFQSTGIIVKIAFLIVSASMFCNWLAFTTSAWRVTSRNPESYSGRGLWRTSSGEPLDGTGDIKYGVIQAFGIVGFLCQNVGYLLIILFIFKDNWKGKGEVRHASAGLLIISAIGWLISVAIFGDMYNSYPSKLHYSYAMAVIACGLGLIGGVLMILEGQDQRQANVR